MKEMRGKDRNGWFPYLMTVGMVAIMTIVNKSIGFDLTNTMLLFLLPVLLSAANWGIVASILAAILGVLSFDIFFVPPVFSITVHDLTYLISFAVFLLVAVMTGTMANKLRNQAETARRREVRTAALYDLSKKIVAETNVEGVLKTVVKVIKETTDSETIILMPDPSGKLQVCAASEPKNQALAIHQAAASWAFKHSKMTGDQIEPWGEQEYLYIPLRTEEKSIGILAVHSRISEPGLSQEQTQLLEAFANLTALAIISLQLSADAEQSKYLIHSERLRNALFQSLSHEIRTPLASIKGAVTGLLGEGERYQIKDRQDLLQSINESAERINRLVGNLLDMARLESGMVKLKKEWCDIQEIMGVVIRSTHAQIPEERIQIKIAEEIPLINVDFILFEQVMVNLLDNAQKYADPHSEILVDAWISGSEIRISVTNYGDPVPDAAREKIFDKFYRLPPDRHRRGTGLGLAICKGIIEAHGGRIWLETKERTNTFIIALPMEEISGIYKEKEGERLER